MIGAMKDITLRKEEEHQLRLLESVVTHTKDAVIITSTEIIEEIGAEIIYINKAFLEMTGFAPEDVLGKSTRVLTGPETNFAEIARLKTAMRKGESCNIKSIFYKKNGETYWGSLAIAPVTDSSGEIKNYIAINRDITDIINYIKEIEDQNKRLREISWTQSHLVRGPLSRILGLVNLMTLDKEQASNEELLPLLQKSASDLDDVIKEIIRKTREFNKPLN
jgi:PAS domain S-box-containing protein